MIEATTIAKTDLCRACFDGEYPMELPDPELLGKQLLRDRRRRGDAAGAATLRRRRRGPAAGGAADALTAARDLDPLAGRRAEVDDHDRARRRAGDRHLRGGRRRHRGGRPRRRADEGVGGQGAAGPRSLGGLGGFAGLFDASALKRYERPLLATSTDGVGTKVAIAQRMGVHDTIGHDLVGMVVDDLVVCGAEPLFMTDYIAVGKVVPERVAAIVKGIAEGCVLAGCALVGGETAEHPGLLGPDEYDVAGAGTGVVEADRPARRGPGARRVTSVIAMASSGLHSNGYSLVRHVLRPRPAGRWTAHVDGARPHARRGAAGADPDLLAGLPRR